jgi:hypothetical protein
MNKDGAPHDFLVTIEADDDVQSHEDGRPSTYRLDPAAPRFTVAPGEVFNAAVRVRRDAWTDADPSTELHFAITATDDPGLTARAEARFFAPRD